MSAQMLEVSIRLLGVGTVLRLKRDAWSMVKLLRQATENEYAPPPPPPKTPPSPHRLYDLRDTHNKLMHSTAVRFCPPQKRASIVSVHRLINITLLTLVQASSKESRRPIPLMTTHLVARAMGASHTACNDDFRRNFRCPNWSAS